MTIHRIESICADYLTAVESNDRPAMARLRSLAVTEPELRRELDLLIDGLIEEWCTATTCRSVLPSGL